MMITLLIAFAVGIVLGKVMLPVLHKLKFGQNIYRACAGSAQEKAGYADDGRPRHCGRGHRRGAGDERLQRADGAEHAAGHAADGAGQSVHRLCGRHDQDPQGQERRPDPQAEDDLSDAAGAGVLLLLLLPPAGRLRHQGAVLPRGMGFGHLVYPDDDVHHRGHDQQRQPA